MQIHLVWENPHKKCCTARNSFNMVKYIFLNTSKLYFKLDKQNVYIGPKKKNYKKNSVAKEHKQKTVKGFCEYSILLRDADLLKGGCLVCECH